VRGVPPRHEGSASEGLKSWGPPLVMDVDELNKLGRSIKSALKSAKQPLTLSEIAHHIGASIYDVHDALSTSLHGWVEMRNNKYKLL